MKYNHENGVRFAGGQSDIEISLSLKLGRIRYDFVGCVQALSDIHWWGWVSSKRTVCPLIIILFPPDKSVDLVFSVPGAEYGIL